LIDFAPHHRSLFDYCSKSSIFF